MKENKKEYIIITSCPFCGEINEIAVSEDDYWDWQDGALVQDAFPYLTVDEREMLISGICPDCWNDMFPEDEEEIEWDENDWVDEEQDLDESWYECYDEIGYNPYMGCYDFDC